jgi:hypothetical protein
MLCTQLLGIYKACPSLELQTRPRFRPVSLSLSMSTQKHYTNPKNCLGTKTLPFCYIAKKKDFVTLRPGVNVIKNFPLSLMMRPNKLDCLYLTITFQSSLTFAGNAKSLSKKEASERCSN